MDSVHGSSTAQPCAWDIRHRWRPAAPGQHTRVLIARTAPFAGSITVDLMSIAIFSWANLHKCLPTAVVSIDANCQYWIRAPASDNMLVSAMAATTGIQAYSELTLCPASSAKVNSLQLAFDSYVYGLNATGTGAAFPASRGASVSGVAFPSPGKMVVTFNGNSAITITYAIRSTTGNTSSIDANAVATTGAGFTAGSEFRDAATAGLPCPTGRYGLRVGSIKLCAACPPGTTGSNGYGCKACPVGTSSEGVAYSGSCSPCSAGTYAQEGEWRPMPLRRLHTVHWQDPVPSGGNSYCQHAAVAVPVTLLAALVITLPCSRRRQLQLPALPPTHLLWRWRKRVHALVGTIVQLQQGGYVRS